VRRAALTVCTAVLLAGPTVLAFFAGGHFDGARSVAAGAAWAVVFVLALAGPLPFPASAAGRVALAGLVGLAAWSAISVAWAPLAGPASDGAELLLLYVGVLLAAIGLLRNRPAARAVEPALALGALVVIGYGLAGRLLPGIVELSRSGGAGGRLEQPITYWNGEGLLAAIGLILCVRLAGDRSRAAGMRVAAAAACAPLGMGVYLSYSRGAAAVTGIGLIALVAARPSWPQLRAAVLGLGTAVVTAVCAITLSGVASLEGTPGERQRDGAIMLAILVVLTVAAAVLTARAASAERSGSKRQGTLPHARRLPVVTGAAAMLCFAALIAGGLLENADSSERAVAGPSRYASVSSLRYEYWRVGVDAFLDEPVKGVGSGGFRVVWRMERRVNATATNAHSLILETMTELGLPGLLFLLLFLSGVAAGARRALSERTPLSAGGAAVCIAWLLHASIDWDWQLPAVTLPALVLAGGLLAQSERSIPPASEVLEETPEPLTLAGERTVSVR
jgi:O-Antigen ligase